MSAATTAEWAASFALGAGAFIPGALLILALDHDLMPRAAERTVQRVWFQAAVLLLVLAGPIDAKGGAR
ncbi:hypothetical protein AB0E06_10275 [Streptomyces sp. NPDC048109]|uniref:hypothetical protein n=1 Tax=Streptomyces sp. NPDC048109 TaxID=3155482 RepID=UPI00343CD30D